MQAGRASKMEMHEMISTDQRTLNPVPVLSELTYIALMIQHIWISSSCGRTSKDHSHVAQQMPEQNMPVFSFRFFWPLYSNRWLPSMGRLHTLKVFFSMTTSHAASTCPANFSGAEVWLLTVSNAWSSQAHLCRWTNMNTLSYAPMQK